MGKAFDRIMGSLNEALGVARGDIQTIKHIRVTPSCGCVYCDVTLEPKQDEGGWYHSDSKGLFREPCTRPR